MAVFARLDIMHEIKKISAPTLVLVGKEDILKRPSHMKVTAITTAIHVGVNQLPLQKSK